MEIQKNVSLLDKHTFGLPWKTRFFCVITKQDDLNFVYNFAKENKINTLVLGGGSNMLPTETYAGLVIQNKLKGKEIVKETKNHVWIKVSSGENWHKFVLWTIRNNFFGLENLSLIPGTVGGAVVQNIGAYDVDVQRYITEVSGYSLDTGKEKKFTHKQCQFDYRNSIFKKTDDWFVGPVTLKLPKQFKPVLTYKPLRSLQEKSRELTAKQVSKEVIRIRRSKLPDWKKTGTAKSFQNESERITKTPSRYSSVF